VSAVLFCLVSSARALTFEVGPHVQECFYETVRLSAPVNVRYQVIKGGFLDVDVTMYDPTRQVVYDAQRETEGNFAFAAEKSGDYFICFSNRMSTLTPKTINLEFFVGRPPVQGPSAALEPLEAEIRRISQAIEELKNGQTYLKNREIATRDTSESTNTRVLWSSLFEALALAAVSVFQVYSIKRFFEVKRVI